MVLQQLMKLLMPILILFIISVAMAGIITIIMIILDYFKSGRNR